jgi:hypothetical protein
MDDSKSLEDAIDDWTGFHFGDISFILRNLWPFKKDVPTPYKKYIESIRVLDSNMNTGFGGKMVYRGFQQNTIIQLIGSQSPDNFEFTDYGYFATSTNLLIAKGFKHGDTCCVMKLYIPDWVKALDLKEEFGEDEILLQRGLTFNVIKSPSGSEVDYIATIKNNQDTMQDTIQDTMQDTMKIQNKRISNPYKRINKRISNKYKISYQRNSKNRKKHSKEYNKKHKDKKHGLKINKT